RSGRSTSILSIVAPRSRRSRSRTIVSTSGSSGILRDSLDLAPGDVAAEVSVLDSETGHAGPARLRGGPHGISEAGYRQDATARGDETGVAARGSGVQDQGVLPCLEIGRDVDG